MDFGILALLLGPVILAAVWAAWLLATRKSKGKVGGTGRQDHTEPRSLTGPEQHKHRPESGWAPDPR